MPIDETHPQTPVNPYGESKLMVEKILRWYGDSYGLRWVALRYFNAAGADPDGEIGEDHDPETHLIPLVIDAARGTRPPVGLRHRLSDAGRHGDPRLRPRHGSRRPRTSAALDYLRKGGATDRNQSRHGHRGGPCAK